MAHGRDAAPEKVRVRVRIGDEEYVLRGEASPEYMKQLAKTVDETFSRLQAMYRNVPRHRVAIFDGNSFGGRGEQASAGKQRAGQPARGGKVKA